MVLASVQRNFADQFAVVPLVDQSPSGEGASKTNRRDMKSVDPALTQRIESINAGWLSPEHAPAVSNVFTFLALTIERSTSFSCELTYLVQAALFVGLEA